MCVSKDAACFESYQCDYRGFACKSDVDQCVEAHDKIVRDYNTLLADYEALRQAGNELAESHERIERELEELKVCLASASTIEDGQNCDFWALASVCMKLGSLMDFLANPKNFLFNFKDKWRWEWA